MNYKEKVLRQLGRKVVKKQIQDVIDFLEENNIDKFQVFEANKYSHIPRYGEGTLNYSVIGDLCRANSGYNTLYAMHGTTYKKMFVIYYRKKPSPSKPIIKLGRNIHPNESQWVWENMHKYNDFTTRQIYDELLMECLRRRKLRYKAQKRLEAYRERKQPETINKLKHSGVWCNPYTEKWHYGESKGYSNLKELRKDYPHNYGRIKHAKMLFGDDYKPKVKQQKPERIEARYDNETNLIHCKYFTGVVYRNVISGGQMTLVNKFNVKNDEDAQKVFERIFANKIKKLN